MQSSFWSGRRVLVTGHTGFKGAWLTLWLQNLGAQVAGVSLEPPAGGAFEAMRPWGSLLDHRGDIREPAVLPHIVREFEPEVVFHLAAQALVRAGYEDPGSTFATNVGGTNNLLASLEESDALLVAVVVTSDKVYAVPNEPTPLAEGAPLGGGDPYSASKAATEMVVAGWRGALGSEGPRLATVRAGNVIGGGDVARDRLLPDVFRATEHGETVWLRYPDATRPWQFVLDPLDGYMRFASALVESDDLPPSLNFGPSGDSDVRVKDLVEMTFSYLGRGRWESSDADLEETLHLSLDASKARERLGWEPRLQPDAAVAWTVEWERGRWEGADLRQLALAQIARYTEATA